MTNHRIWPPPIVHMIMLKDSMRRGGCHDSLVAIITTYTTIKMCLFYLLRSSSANNEQRTNNWLSQPYVRLFLTIVMMKRFLPSRTASIQYSLIDGRHPTNHHHCVCGGLWVVAVGLRVVFHKTVNLYSRRPRTFSYFYCHISRT